MHNNTSNNLKVNLEKLWIHQEKDTMQKVESAFLCLKSAHSFIDVHSALYKLGVLLRTKEHNIKIDIIKDIANLNNIDLNKYLANTKISAILSACLEIPNVQHTVSIIFKIAELQISELSHHLHQFTQDNNYLFALSNHEIDNILYIYRNKSDSINKIGSTNIVPNPQVTLTKLYNEILDNFPKLAKICQESIKKDSLDTSKNTIADLPSEVQQHIFSYLSLKDIAIPNDNMMNSEELVELIGSICKDLNLVLFQ